MDASMYAVMHLRANLNNVHVTDHYPPFSSCASIEDH